MARASILALKIGVKIIDFLGDASFATASLHKTHLISILLHNEKSFLRSIFSFRADFLHQKRRGSKKERYKVGLCIVATGKYDGFAKTLIESARMHFLKNHDVTYFVFTDGQVLDGKDVVKVFQKRLGWPYDTLKRFHIYASSHSLLQNMDYLFAIDADMRFDSSVGDEILSDLVATRHFGFANGQRGTYEKRKTSTANVSWKDAKKAEGYYAGAFLRRQKGDVFYVFGSID